MTVNYHTHTARCLHASGTEREYIETAISRGLTELGFSDHCPMPFPGEYRSGHRMTVEEFPDHIADLLALREEYRDRIKIRIGLEVEYYPAVFPDLIRLIAPYPVEYLILGQHFLGNEYDDRLPCSAPTDSEERLAAYVAQVTEALSTGAFTYLAHPDVFNFTGEDIIYRKHMSKLIMEAKKRHIPLEYNLLGLNHGRHYPSHRFWSLVAEYGEPVVIGCDAHEPNRVASVCELLEAYHFLNELRIRTVDHIQFRPVPKTV